MSEKQFSVLVLVSFLCCSVISFLSFMDGYERGYWAGHWDGGRHEQEKAIDAGVAHRGHWNEGISYFRYGCKRCEENRKPVTVQPKMPWKVIPAGHQPAIAEQAVRIHDDRPWVHTIFLDGEPVADVKDMRESWKWDHDANGWEVATSDGDLLWIPEEKTWGMKIIWRIEGRQYAAR